MAKLAALPRQSEWEACVAQFQKTGTDASADDKWRLLERIYEIDESNTSNAIEGYVKTTDKYNRRG
jgi:L-rhamnose mutarotase